MKYINLKKEEQLLENKNSITKLYLKRKIKNNNIIVISNLLKETKVFFDNINGISLDLNQRKAIITEEQNKLIVAGAGSGKTLTIVAYIKYLIEIKKVNPEMILCISFTNETINNLKDKIKYNIDIYTFHKLALTILNKENNIIDENYLDFIINEILYFLNDKTYESKLIKRFINLKQSNNVINYQHIQKKDKNYLKVIDLIYKIYISEKRSQLLIDFADMINLATKEQKHKFYDYIIIDEFQDTSLNRLNLIKSLLQKNTHLIVVGDDFQSIYRFNGCDLNIFLNLPKLIRYTKIFKITNTYRNAQELTEIAGKFIMQNKNQIKKQLIANKHLNKPIKICYYYNQKTILEKIINLINSSQILILGRNNFDIDKYLNSNFIYKPDKLVYLRNQDINIKYLTIHRSKGLESNNVIVLNVNNDIYGLPNKLKDENILKYVTKKERFPYAEERRLFYVALTRTKNNVYLLVNKSKPSIFIKELIKKFKKKIEIHQFS